jgi:hypothetical protein
MDQMVQGSNPSRDKIFLSFPECPDKLKGPPIQWVLEFLHRVKLLACNVL